MKIETKRPIIIITGATASGKSAYALKLAGEVNGVIINADAMQLYREAPILTAQPSNQERAQAPHLLYGVLQADDVCNAARYITMVRPIIEEALQSSKTPIVTGGTGLYLKALQRGIAHIPEIPDAVRQQVRSMSASELWQALLSHDLAVTKQLNPQDTQRLARALEVVLATSKSLLWWQQQPINPPFKDADFKVIITELPRNELYQRINLRYANMVQNGGLLEAQQLHQAGLSDDLPLMRAVGVRQLLNHLHGDYDLQAAITAGQAASRQYAKRQLTWLRHQIS